MVLTRAEHLLPLMEFSNTRDHFAIVASSFKITPLLPLGRSGDILDILDHTRDLQASDPRGRIYELIGAIDPENSILPLPDYAMTATEVFTLFSRHLIEATRTLIPLYYAPETDSSLPNPS